MCKSFTTCVRNTTKRRQINNATGKLFTKGYSAKQKRTNDP